VKLEDWMNTNGVKMMILNGIIRKMNCKMNLIQNQREQHNSKEAKSMKKAKEII
jgi:phosphoribosylformylglycinamidine (FGAM) synthase-like amidotransferase family enzyme